MGSVVSFWWASVAQETAVVLAGEVGGSWVGCVGARFGNLDMAMFCEIFLVGDVLVRRVVGAFEVSK